MLPIPNEYTPNCLRSILLRCEFSLPPPPACVRNGSSARPNEPKTAKSCLFRAFHEHLSYPTPALRSGLWFPLSPPTLPALAERRCAVPSLRTAAASGGSPPVAASNSGHASPAGRPSSLGVAASSSATSCRSCLEHHQPPPEVPQVVGEPTPPKPHLVGSEPVAAQPRHLHRLG